MRITLRCRFVLNITDRTDTGWHTPPTRPCCLPTPGGMPTHAACPYCPAPHPTFDDWRHTPTAAPATTHLYAACRPTTRPACLHTPHTLPYPLPPPRRPFSLPVDAGYRVAVVWRTLTVNALAPAGSAQPRRNPCCLPLAWKFNDPAVFVGSTGRWHGSGALAWRAGPYGLYLVAVNYPIYLL